jgi:hypothetical protein
MEETSTQRVRESNFDLSGTVENDIGEPIVGKNSLSTSATRSVYLITYSQADLQKFTCRADFARAVVESFTQGNCNVSHWCCSLEEHTSGGKHYHMSLKLNKVQRWLASKRFLTQTYGISVHYSNVHHNYFSAWRYVTKSDTQYEESIGHPDLRNAKSPRMSEASAKKSNDATKRKRKNYTKTKGGPEKVTKRSKAGKKKRLTPLLVSELILDKNIMSVTELHALAQEQRDQGKTDLVEFILNRSPKKLTELIQTTWEMKGAKEKITRSRKTVLSDCTTACNGAWLQCATELLNKNGVDIEMFAQLVKECLTKGRGKHRNVMIVGPANCGKTFILKPLTQLYATFCNPASGSFAWIGIQDVECIFLNDFRWNPQLIPWHDLLLMLEGEVVHLPAPKTHFTEDIEFVKDTPIFCTSKRPLIYIKNGVVDDRETEMMAVRWRVLYFNYQIPQEKQLNIPPCKKCFAQLLLI